MANGMTQSKKRRAILERAVVGVGWLLMACSTGTYGTDTGAGRLGNPEESEGAAIRIDPASIEVSKNGAGWVVSLSVTGITGSAGELMLQIEAVDASSVFSRARMSYELAAGQTLRLEAPIELPQAAAEEDLSTWNVRVTTPEDTLVNVVRSLLYVASPRQVELHGPSALRAGKKGAYRVSVQHPLTRKPVPSSPVVLEVTAEGQAQAALSIESVTDEMGVAAIALDAPLQGSYEVQASSSGGVSVAKLKERVQVHAESGKVLLTTDKPIYKPGHVIHVRALALKNGDNTPLAGADALIEIEDGKGNKIYKRSFKSDAFGVVSSQFRLGSVVNEGTFKIRTSVGEFISEKSVQVGQYALPKFEVSVQTDKDWYLPGETVEGVVDARYFFGKKVGYGSIHLEASAVDIGLNTFARVMGTTDLDGRFAFSFRLPDTLVGLPLEQGVAMVNLSIVARDTAGQEVAKAHALRVAPQPLRVSVVPEAGELVSGVENRLSVFVSDPLGAPVAGAKVAFRHASLAEQVQVTTNAEGFATVLLPESELLNPNWIAVVEANNKTVEEPFSYRVQGGSVGVLVRTNKSVYEVGEVVTVDVLTTDKSGHVFLDLIHEGQQVEVRTLQAQAGSASSSFTLDASLAGSTRVEAYVVDAAGNLVRAGRTIFTRNASSLSVDLATDKPLYAPGEPAQLTFSVKDEKGQPQVAALGVQVVDQAVFALVDAQPGLLKSYFELESSFAQPSYQLRAPLSSFNDLFFADKSQATNEEQAAHQAKAEAVLAALSYQPTGLHLESWGRVVTLGNQKLQPFFEAERLRIATEARRLLSGAKAIVEARGCRAADYFCAEGTYDQAVLGELAKRLSAYDFWGNGYTIEGLNELTLKTQGADELPGTRDDVNLTLGLLELDPDWYSSRGGIDADSGQNPAPPFGVPAPGNGAATGGTSSEGGPNANGGEASGPRVRSNFPETLYVNPLIITDATGKATVNIDLADSITEWRVSSMANAANGKLGSGVHGITVFQDFFVDINFPATLTRGDEVTFPIAVYNYLTTPQTVNLELEQADWFTALGASTASVALAPGEVRGVSFPVRVEKVGLRSLTVRGLGTEKSDAVSRMVRVVPDGKLIAAAHSGNVGAPVSHQVTFSPEAVEGSQQLFLNVFPTFLSQTVQGMDSILAMPSGCFEQTTSSAWPNVLVTDYMQKTKQITPEILLKAESYMSAGYQRLLTFEHPGGGFSWFGTQDAAPFLSVTAFGLMEFSDMSRVHDVDERMVERTRTWLLGQQQANGSWLGDMSEFFSFHTSGVRNTAFVLWALAENGYKGPQATLGLDYVRAQLNAQESDPYTLALIANAAAVFEPAGSLANQVFDRLVALATVDGSDATKVFWDSAGTQTNFYGYGQDAAVASTAMVTHALLLRGGYGDLVSRALNYLASQRDPYGNFGSTQATIWTLRTLLLAASKGTEAAVGTLSVSVDGAPVSSIALTPAQSDVMTTLDLGQYATPGLHNVTLSFTGTGRPAYNLVSRENLPFASVPAPPPEPLSVAIVYSRTQLAVDATVTATVTVTNNTSLTQDMALVTLGLPPGFEVHTEDFAPYLQEKTLSKFELTGKQVLLYVPIVPKLGQLTFSYRLRATMPVKASDGGASVYPYYQPDRKMEVAATTLEATAN